MKLSKPLLTLLFSINYVLLGASSTLEITPKEAVLKTEEIFQAHIKFKEFNTEVAKRTFQNYLEELDPLKTYFTLNEIQIYLEPSDALLEQVTIDFKQERFTEFETIYTLMTKAIERRNSLEAKLDSIPLTKGVKAKDIHESGWAKSDADLLHKLAQIHSLQKEAAEKFESQEKTSIFFQRITKRRLNREKDLLGSSRQDQRQQVLVHFLKSVSAALDSHTMYFTPQEAKQFLIQVQQRLFGIGAQLRDDLNGFTIVQIVDGGPASKEGSLKNGDKIISVNHEPIVGMDINEAVELIRGPQGTSVILTIVRGEAENEQTFDVAIVRDEVVIKDSRYEMREIPFGNGTIGYIALHSFYQDPKSSSSGDVKNAIEQLKKEGHLKGIIFDLRNNSGGLLPQAINICGLFIKKGVVASIKDHTGKHQRLRNLNGDIVWDGPLVILTNRASASASEIVAMSLADYGRALVIGDKATYGKGSYQTFTLESANPDRINPQGEYKVTRGTYYTVGGGTPQQVGVQASIEIPGILSKMEIGEKFSRYPLPNDSISPLFDDDLSDVHALYRIRLKKMLGKDVQQPSDELLIILPTLSKNSGARIQKNRNYVNFIAALDQIDRYDFDPSLVGQNDLQLDEAINVLKEMIVMQSPKRTSRK